jgi:hypothetical protein
LLVIKTQSPPSGMFFIGLGIQYLFINTKDIRSITLRDEIANNTSLPVLLVTRYV